MQEENNSMIISITGFLGGYSAKNNFDVELKLKFPESEVVNALQFVGGIGNHIKMLAKVEGNKIDLGEWTVHRLTVDKEAQTTVVFKSTIENSAVNELSGLVVEDAEIHLKAKITK